MAMLLVAASAGGARQLVSAQVPAVAHLQPIRMEAQVIPPAPRVHLRMTVRGPTGYRVGPLPMAREDPTAGVFDATFTPVHPGRYEVTFAIEGTGQVFRRPVTVHPGAAPTSPWRVLLPAALLGGYVLMWLRMRRVGR